MRRVVRNGFQNIRRNFGLSVATTFVTVLTLFAVSLILMINLLLSVALESVQEKVDISVYFDSLASQEQIAKVQAEITNMPEVAAVRLVDREEALDEFRTSHGDNDLISASLDELDENPLQTTLVISAESPELYESIDAQLSSKVDGQIIDRVDFDDNRETIDRLSTLSFWAKTGGLVAGGLLTAIALLVVYNTIRLTIYSRKEAIGIMKLVGATNGFVRGPFLIEGTFYGFMASVLTLAILLPILYWLSPKVESFFGTTSFVFDFVINNIGLMIAGELGIGILLGVVSSLFAMHRYLKV